MIYFDNSATSLKKPDSVKKILNNALGVYTANPGRSGHKYSALIAEKIFETREKVKNFFEAKDYECIFTKNCTEALNLVIFGLLKPGDHVITTVYEHNSVLRPLEELKKKGVEVDIVDCALKDFSKMFVDYVKENTKLVITTFVSNVTGDICAVEEVDKICKEKNIFHLVDGAQSSGHMKVSMEKIGADFYTFSGHKGLLSITGVGGVIIKDIKMIKPLLFGGTGISSESLNQTNDTIESFEAGTIPSIPILTLGSGIDFLRKNLEKIIKIEQKLNKYLYFKLKNLKFLTIYSNENSLNVFSFNIKNLDSTFVADELNVKYNICVRAGLHCAPLVHKKLKTLDTGAVRVSLDFNNTFDEIDYLITALSKINQMKI